MAQTLSSDIQQAKRLPISGRQITLIVVFIFLLIAVIVGCTIGSSPYIAVALVVGVAVVGIALQRPSLALILIFIGAGFPSVLIPVPGHTIRPLELPLVLCLLIIVLKRPRFEFRLPHLLMLLFFAIAVISFIHVPEFATDANIYGANKRLYEELLVLIAFFSGTLLFGYIKSISAFMVTILLGNLVFYLIGLAQALNVKVPSILGSIQDPSTNQGRLSGPSFGPVAFGFFLSDLFAVSLACWLLGKNWLVRLIGAIMTVATVLEIIGSGTRSVTVAVGIVLVVALIITKRFKLFIGLVLVSLGGLLLFPGKILSQFTHPDSSSSNRLFLWQVAIKLIAANPIIGIGLQQFHVYYERLLIGRANQLDAHGVSIHNQYLNIALEGGILWLLITVLLISSIIFLCWRYYRFAASEERVLLLAAILAMTAIPVISFLDVPLESTEAAVFLYLLGGMGIGCVIQIRRRMQAKENLC